MSRSKKRCLLDYVAAMLLAAAVLLTVPEAKAQGGGQAAPAGNADKGKQLFTNYGCYQCHGREAQGGAGGPRIGPNPIPLLALTRYVRQPGGQMPPYTEKVVSDAELADIYAFLQSRAQPKPAREIPLLND